MRYKRTKKILLFWCLFIGVGALLGGITMLIDPTGKLMKMDEMLHTFKFYHLVIYYFKILFFLEFLY